MVTPRLLGLSLCMGLAVAACGPKEAPKEAAPGSSPASPASTSKTLDAIKAKGGAFLWCQCRSWWVRYCGQ